MEKLRTELEKKQVTIHGKIAVLRVEMKELVQADNPDRNAIEKKMREVSDLQYQLKVNGLDHQFAVKGILTPEQQKIWKKHLLRMGEEQMGMEMERVGRMMRRERQKTARKKEEGKRKKGKQRPRFPFFLFPFAFLLSYHELLSLADLVPLDRVPIPQLFRAYFMRTRDVPQRVTLLHDIREGLTVLARRGLLRVLTLHDADVLGALVNDKVLAAPDP